MAFDYDTITTALDGLLTTQQVDYKTGTKEFKNGQKVDQLIAMAKLEIMAPAADLVTVAFDHDVDEFGVDHTQYAVPVL